MGIESLSKVKSRKSVKKAAASTSILIGRSVWYQREGHLYATRA